MKVSLKWITPDADKMIAHMARVSNPAAKEDDPTEKLISYLIKHKHFSPFEMACMCVEIETTRDIARQILRHRSFHFQEFSQRYSEVDEEAEFAEARLQDLKNRQNSIITNDDDIQDWWNQVQVAAWYRGYEDYKAVLKSGIAKELARKLLPEGLTRTRMYMQGTIRDWIHYLAVRTEKGTQKEHQEIAWDIEGVLAAECPLTFKAACQAGVLVE